MGRELYQSDPDARPWGVPPWEVPVVVPALALPERADVAVVGAGLTGLAAAWHLARRNLRVVVLEATRVGDGASGRSGGIALEDTAAGPLPRFKNCLDELKAFDCELDLGGCWEISHSSRLPARPLNWKDGGSSLRVSARFAGGAVHPGRLLAGVARAALEAGATIHEHAPVTAVEFAPSPQLRLPGGTITADRVVLATNAFAFELSALQGQAVAMLALALATAPIEEEQVAALGLAERRPFYTADLPYLWGRLTADNRLVLGGGLVGMDESHAARPRFKALEKRLRGFHPVLRPVEVTHRWLGPICIPANFRPILRAHPRSKKVLFGGGYAGHGLAQSLRMGRLLAEAVAS